MSLDVARELIEVGLATDVQDVEELHRTDGPAVLTACCRARATLIWVEHEHRRADQAADQRRVIAALQPILQEAGLVDVALLPTISARATAIYPGLPASSLLVDALLPTNPGAIDSDKLLAGCQHLASCLGRLHSTPRATVPRALLRCSAAIQAVTRLVDRGRAAAPATLGLEVVQELLAYERRELADALASACTRFDQCPDSVVLHGRFCPGFVVAGTRDGAMNPRILGWTAAAFGPAEFDLGWFVGEFEELAAAREGRDPHGARLLRIGAAEFVRAYLAERRQDDPERFLRDCGTYAAVKVVAHLSEYARYFTLDVGAAELQLSLAERLIEPTWAIRLLAEETA